MCADFGNTMILLAPKGYRAITDISYNILLGFSLIDTYSTKTKAIQSYSCVMNQLNPLKLVIRQQRKKNHHIQDTYIEVRNSISKK